MQYLIERGMISKQQHGFLARHSTCTQLLECLHDWSIAINNKKSLDIIYIDYSRVFDSVVHSKLLLKLKSCGIKYDLFNWISSFLYNRKQRVILTLIMLMGVFFYPQTHIFNRCLVKNRNISKSFGDFS